MSVLTRLWPDNPVLTKELRVRMRGTRAYWIITAYLAFLSFILFMQYSLWWSQAQARGGGFSMGSKIGQGFFWAIVITQMFLVAFITPAITSGGITIEREQRTLEMLEMTRLPRGSIVAGKLMSAMGFVVLLVVSSLPLTSICFFLGGVSPEEVIRWYLLLIAFSFVTAALGLVWSAVARTTAAAVLLTYGSLLVPILVFVVTAGIAGPAMYFGGGTSGFNPALSLIYILGILGVTAPDSGTGPLSGLTRAWDGRHYYGLTLPIWAAPVLTYTLIGITLAAVAAARLETFPERKAGRLRLLVLLTMIQQLFFFFGARFSVYAGAATASGASIAGAFPLLYMLTYPTALLLACIPIFATGELRTTEARNFTGYLASGWSRRGLRRGKIASGLPYLLGLVALIIGMYCLSFLLVGRPSGITRGMPAAIGARSSLPGRNPSAASSPAAAAATTNTSEEDHGTDLLKVIATLTATVIGMSTLGLMFSVMTRNRWAGMALLYVVVLAIIAGPAIARADYNASQSGAPSIFINLYYLNPLMAIAELSENTGQFWNNMNLMFGQIPIWAVTTVMWLFITGVSLLMMLPFINKIASGPVLPYEDLDTRY